MAYGESSGHVTHDVTRPEKDQTRKILFSNNR